MDSDRREEVLRIARLIVAETGIGGLTVRKVAREAGIGASTLRYYFPSQEDLHSAVIRSQFDESVSDGSISDSSLDPRDRFLDCLQQFLPQRRHDVNVFSQWIVGLASANPSADPDLTSRILDLMTERSRIRVTAWCDVLVDEGALRERVSPHTVSLLCAVVNGLSFELASRSASIDVKDASTILGDVVDRFIIFR